MQDPFELIRLRQRELVFPQHEKIPPHRPQILYIGCIDARLDPIRDIGIPRGEALILRNIGALVPKGKYGEGEPVSHATFAGGEVPHNVSIGAALEFFLNYIPLREGGTKHVIVSGHTDCGGIRACQHGHFHASDHYLPTYLKGFDEAREKVNREAKLQGWDEVQILHALEEEAVRGSYANLLSYPAVTRALAENTLQLHGWVINTATHRITEMNPKTLQFEPIAQQQAGRGGRG